MKRYIGLALLLVLNLPVHSAHIASASMSYSCLGNEEYQFELVMYRDCFGAGAQFDQFIEIGVYNEGLFVDALEVPLTLFESVQVESYEDCNIDVNQYCLEKASYQFTLTLPISLNAYTVHYSRCCWSATIANIVDPTNTGITVLSEISPKAQEVCNTVAPFNMILSNPVCTGVPVEFTLPLFDSEGDSLVYTTCFPYKGGGTVGSNGQGDPTSCLGIIPDPALCPPTFEEIDILPPFTADNPFPTLDGFHIDNDLGTVQFTPTVQGRFLFGLCVEEYRNGEFLGSQTVNLSSWDLLTSSTKDVSNAVHWNIVSSTPDALILKSSLDNTYDTNVVLYNVEGMEISKSNLTINHGIIDISILPHGLYFVEIQNEKGRQTLKFVKSK